MAIGVQLGPAIIWPDVLRKNSYTTWQTNNWTAQILLLSYHKDVLDFMLTCFDAGLNIVGRSKRLLLDAGSSLYLQFSYYNITENFSQSRVGWIITALSTLFAAFEKRLQKR